LFEGSVHKICEDMFSFVNSLLLNAENDTNVKTFKRSLDQYVLKSNYILKKVDILLNLQTT